MFGYFLGASKKLPAQQSGIKVEEYKAFEWKDGSFPLKKGEGTEMILLYKNSYLAAQKGQAATKATHALVKGCLNSSR